MSPAPRKNWLEWTVFGIGAVLLLAIASYLVLQAVQPPHQEVQIAVRIGAPEPGPRGHVVPVELHNSGGAAAAQVSVEVVLDRGAAGSERAALIIDFLPGNSRRTGRVVFRSDPRNAKLVAQSVSYAEP